MGWQDRPYNRDEGRSGSAGGVARIGNIGFTYPAWGSITLWFILINFAMLLLDGVVTRAAGRLSPAGLGLVADFFAFSIHSTFMRFHLWELITFQFQHSGFGHLFGNMLFLFFFGPMVESYLGSRRFLAFFLLCGVAGALAYVGLWGLNLFDTSTVAPLVGASAGVFGVMIGALLVAPNTRVLLFLLIPVPLKAVVFLALFAAVFVLVGGGPNAGGEAAHLGGAVLGLLLMKVPSLLNWADYSGFSSPAKAVTKLGNAARDRRANRRRDEIAREEAEVDRILAKVKASGMHSLTEREKKTLQKATERQRWAG